MKSWSCFSKKAVCQTNYHLFFHDHFKHKIKSSNIQTNASMKRATTLKLHHKTKSSSFDYQSIIIHYLQDPNCLLFTFASCRSYWVRWPPHCGFAIISQPQLNNVSLICRFCSRLTIPDPLIYHFEVSHHPFIGFRSLSNLQLKHVDVDICLHLTLNNKNPFNYRTCFVFIYAWN